MTALSGRSAELLRQNQLLLAQIELLSHRVQEVCIRPNEIEVRVVACAPEVHDIVILSLVVQ